MTSRDETLRLDIDASIAGVGNEHIAFLIARGATAERIASLGQRQAPFGVLNVQTGDDGRWWPAADGWFALVVPVVERGELIDIVALDPARPQKWWWRVGYASLLGADRLNDGWHEYPLRVVSTPLDWVVAGGDAVCILDWSCADHELSPLRDRVEVACDNGMLAARLRKRLAQPRRIPKITYETEARHVATA